LNLFSISLRNVRTRALSTVLTTLSVALGSALLCSIWLMIDAAERHFRDGQLGYNAIVGPKQGSALELVLNTAFNRGISPGLVPLSVYEELHDEKLIYNGRALKMRSVVPQARGDNYKGFPIVGTTDEMFSKWRRGSAGELVFAAGKPWVFGHADLIAFARKLAEAKAHDHDHDHGKEGDPPHDHDHEHVEVPTQQRAAVLGSTVARRLQLAVGSKITPTHGLSDEEGAHVHEESVSAVVGVLAETGTAVDEAIYIPLSAFLAIQEHDALKGESKESGSVGLSAIVVNPADRLGPGYLRDAFQTRLDAQVAFTNTEVTRLLELVGNAADVLRVVSYFVLFVAGLGILVALYNTMNERRREIAIMRSLGARRLQIEFILVQEAVFVSILGALVGIAICHAGLLVAQDVIEQVAKVRVEPTHFLWKELWLIVGAAVLGAISGLVPAWKGARTQVAENLGPIS